MKAGARGAGQVVRWLNDAERLGIRLGEGFGRIAEDGRISVANAKEASGTFTNTFIAAGIRGTPGSGIRRTKAHPAAGPHR